MPEPDVFQLADRALARVVAQIEPSQWDMILPDQLRHAEPARAAAVARRS